MPSNALISDTLIIVGALAIFVERITELLINSLPWFQDWDPEKEEWDAQQKADLAGGQPKPRKEEEVWSRPKKMLKQWLVMGTAIGAAFLIVFLLDLRLVSDIFQSAELSDTQDGVITAFLIGGGSAPAHEIIKYIGNKKKKAEKEEKRLT